MSITNGTNITSIEKPAVGVDAGPGWATALNNSLDAIDNHDHTTNKGSRITPAALNINADVEFNENQLTEVKGVVFSQSSASSTNAAVYSTSGNLYWRNSSGVAVQITDGSGVKSGAGSIDNMGTDAGNQAGASYSDTSKSFSFFTDQGNSDMGKMNHADLNLYKFSDNNSADTDYITLQASSSISGAGGTITVPGETGTMLTSNSSVTDINITSSTDLKPILTLKNTNSGVTGPTFKFVNDKGAAGASNDICGIISFYGDDAAQTNMEFAKMEGIVAVHTDGQEGGQLKFSVASHDGEMQTGLIITDGSAEDEIDVTIGNGTASVTSISGTLDLGDRDITSVGDIELDSLTAEGSSITISSNWTAASQTCANLGTVTTADINGGTIDGTTIGASSHTTGKFTTCDATTDFTIGGLVITDNTITDDGALSVVATTSITLDANTLIHTGHDFETSTTGKIKQKGAFLQSSTHQNLLMGY